MSIDQIGMNGPSRFIGQRGRVGDGTGKGGVRYPSPFFDIAGTYLPASMKALLRWCRHYYLTNPLINSTIHKMSEYPVTEIVIDEQNKDVKEKWEHVLTTILRYRPFQIECGLDYYGYGLCLSTIHFPFDKYLVCSNCGTEHRATKTRYRWRNLDYIIVCKKCKAQGPAKVKDVFVKDVSRIRLQRWNPEYLNIEPGFGGADPIYTFEIPTQLKNDILLGKKNILDTLPDVFIEALKRNKFIRFSSDNLYVLKRHIISQKDDGWGMPLILPVLKDTFYLQILRKAQEAIAQEHIVPLRVLFPQAGSGTSDPYSTIPLDNWQRKIETEIAKWKYDNNYIPILPLPIGNQTIGGDGRALMLHQEMEAWSRQIIAGMGVPYEFIFGGMQYSGSNVSMRMVENSFLGYRTDHESMLNSVIKRIAHFMGWPPVKAHMRRFKMADDLQRTAFFFQLNQAQKISDRTLLAESDFDYAVEKERKDSELAEQMEYQRKMQIAQASVQAEVQAIQMRQQMQLQAEQQEQMQAMGMDPAAMDPNGAGGEQGAGPMAQAPGAGPQSGAEGEMVPGPQVNPGMPEGSTVSMENAQQAPNEGIPSEMQSPMTMGTQGGGANILYLAKRAAAFIRQQDQQAQYQMLQEMKAKGPQLYSLVVQILQNDKGSQADPLNPLQSPLPQQRPERRAAPVGA